MTQPVLSLENRLRAAGLKATQARLALLRQLARGHGPFSPEELFASMGSGICDLVTVYRCLSRFEECGLVRRCSFGDGKMRFELHSEQHHHHLVCRGCGKVRALDACVLEEMETALQNSGYRNISHSLEFFGTCENCSV